MGKFRKQTWIKIWRKSPSFCNKSVLQKCGILKWNGPYAPFGFESMKTQLWRNKQNDGPISDSEIKAVLSQLFKTDQWLPPAGHVSEDVTSHA
ncbi:hypothetical protein AVEN_255749-1 [Araneus ventricosus]|uniref:Uncharacterized protein n=1 Tax=Araneus ventricosus TaxID=182803 RepID=A0A4Y2U6V5_ARAVE|nr:hypothetical protein AVEN_44672-1 [Araneus ventricosus]GBO08739.1 hypothetical protein AVEN_222924-1 [Araneus ventricosus]GBO08780.1 hypothetical protein AVEN_51154-1 [Araneus ventricosus]GBO08788.1 hypothetical protein AVEN_255749-1 [Araneus ventricosus]